MKTINDLREILFETIQDVKNGKIDKEKAKVISDISQVIVNTAKAETDYIKQAGGLGTGFIAKGEAAVKVIERPKAEYSNKRAIEKYA